MSYLISSLIILAISLVVALPLSSIRFYDCQAISDRAKLDSLDFNRYLGHWYELYHSKDFYFDHDCRCTDANYSLNADGSIRVDNKCVRNNKTTENIGRATITGNASLSVQFGAPFHAPYDVVYISPDYRYAGVLSCSNVPIFGGLNLWILGRSMDGALNVEQIDDVFQRLRNVGLGHYINDLIETNQTHCYLGQKPTTMENPVDIQMVEKITTTETPNHFHRTNLTSFDLNRYFGHYNVIAEIPDIIEQIFNRHCDCIVVSLDQDMMNVQNCYEKDGIGNNSYQVQQFSAQLERISTDFTRRGMFNQRTQSNTIFDSYQVVDISEDYQHALITNEYEGSLSVYFLSRDTFIPEHIFERFFQVAEQLDIYEVSHIRYLHTDC